MQLSQNAQTPLGQALARCRRHFLFAAAFGAVSNLLYLAPSIYMLQVYDRVVPTGGLGTLAALSILGAAALAALCGLEWLRTLLLIRAGARLENDFAVRVLRRALGGADLGRAERAGLVRDFETIRQGMSGPAAIAAFDAPWTPIYIIVAFLLHPALGLLSVVASALLLFLAWHTDRSIAQSTRVAGEAAGLAIARHDQASFYAAEVRALGMTGALAVVGASERTMANGLLASVGFAGASHASLTKFVRLLLQSASLGVGAVLVVEGSISGGAMIAASLLLARALSPIEQIVGVWKSVAQIRGAFARLTERFGVEDTRDRTLLPEPTGAVSAERLTVLCPGSDRVAIAEVSFAVEPGEIVGVTGPSGAGKSTLLQALAGAGAAVRGTVRYDAVARDDWQTEQLAAAIGYLPQSCALFPGSIRDNISRFRRHMGVEAGLLDAQVVAAAELTGAHQMIARLPQGYDTELGAGMPALSAGQAQRIALARALFGDPTILILDEPTAHFDMEAQQAFVALLVKMRERGTTVLFSSHSADMLARTDKVLTMAAGRVAQFAALAQSLAAARATKRMTAASPVSYSYRSA